LCSDGRIDAAWKPGYWPELVVVGETFVFEARALSLYSGFARREFTAVLAGGVLLLIIKVGQPTP
jgi:hypothetical protein